MSPETNTSPLNVSLSYCSFCCSVTVVPSECETWSSTFTDTMPSVRTCVLTFDALGAELPAVSAGGCSTIVPVDEPAALATVYVISTGLVGTCRAVRYTRLWLTRPVLMPSDGSASTDVTDSTPPIGIHVVGERFDDGGVVRTEQRHIVGRDWLGGFARGRLHLKTCEAGGRDGALGDGVRHVIRAVAVALNVKDRSAAFMVALVFAGGSTVDSCAAAPMCHARTA